MKNQKKPAAIHKRNGTFRADRHSSPGLPTVIPPMPADMSGVAQSQWNIISKQLLDAGLVAEIDGMALRLLCEAYSQWLEARDDCREQGQCIMHAGRKVLNPAYRIFRDLGPQIERLLRGFGMTPASRTGLDCYQPIEDEDDVESIIGFKISG